LETQRPGHCTVLVRQGKQDGMFDAANDEQEVKEGGKAYYRGGQRGRRGVGEVEAMVVAEEAAEDVAE